MTTNSPDPVEWFDDVDRAAPKKPPERMAWVKGNKVREWIMLSPDDAATFQHPDGGRIVDEAKGRTLPFESFEDAADGEARRLALQVEATDIKMDKIRQDRDELAQAIQYDGVTDFNPGTGLRVEKAKDWKGAKYTGEPEDPETTKRDKRVERAHKSLDRLNEDLAAIGPDTTQAQLRNMVKRTMLAVKRDLLITLDLIDDTDSDDA